MESILDSIRKMLGPSEGYDYFDPDILMHINSALFTLTGLGVGPPEGFVIHGPDETWAQFVGGRRDLEAVKTFVYLKVRLVFDPPQSSAVIQSMERQLDELTWRINVTAEQSGT